LINGDLSAALDKEFEVKKSGWIALRASGPAHADSVVPAVFAHTAPIYIDMAGSTLRSREDAQFFLTWIDDLAVIMRTRERIPTEELRRHVDNQLDTARKVYARIAKEGT
jgi:hypothetical protein